ncbi:MAG: hypothetical protein Q9187_002981 [Circinaria calcarea]
MSESAKKAGGTKRKEDASQGSSRIPKPTAISADKPSELSGLDLELLGEAPEPKATRPMTAPASITPKPFSGEFTFGGPAGVPIPFGGVRTSGVVDFAPPTDQEKMAQYLKNEHDKDIAKIKAECEAAKKAREEEFEAEKKALNAQKVAAEKKASRAVQDYDNYRATANEKRQKLIEDLTDTQKNKDEDKMLREFARLKNIETSMNERIELLENKVFKAEGDIENRDATIKDLRKDMGKEKAETRRIEKQFNWAHDRVAELLKEVDKQTALVAQARLRETAKQDELTKRDASLQECQGSLRQSRDNLRKTTTANTKAQTSLAQALEELQLFKKMVHGNDGLQARIRTAELRIAQLLGEIAAFNEDLPLLEKARDEALKDKERISAQRDELQAQVAVLEEEESKLAALKVDHASKKGEDALKQCEADRQKLAKERDELKGQFNALGNELAALKADQARVKAAGDAATEKKKAAEAAKAAFPQAGNKAKKDAAALRRCEADREELKKKLADLGNGDAALKECEAERAACKVEKENLQRELDSANTEREELRTKLAGLGNGDAALKKCEAERTACEVERDNLQARLKNLEPEFNKLRDRNEYLADYNTQAKKDLDNWKDEKMRYEEEYIKLQVDADNRLVQRDEALELANKTDMRNRELRKENAILEAKDDNELQKELRNLTKHNKHLEEANRELRKEIERCDKRCDLIENNPEEWRKQLETAIDGLKKKRKEKKQMHKAAIKEKDEELRKEREAKEQLRKELEARDEELKIEGGAKDRYEQEHETMQELQKEREAKEQLRKELEAKGEELRLEREANEGLQVWCDAEKDELRKELEGKDEELRKEREAKEAELQQERDDKEQLRKELEARGEKLQIEGGVKEQNQQERETMQKLRKDLEAKEAELQQERNAKDELREELDGKEIQLELERETTEQLEAESEANKEALQKAQEANEEALQKEQEAKHELRKARNAREELRKELQAKEEELQFEREAKDTLREELNDVLAEESLRELEAVAAGKRPQGRKAIKGSAYLAPFLEDESSGDEQPGKVFKKKIVEPELTYAEGYTSPVPPSSGEEYPASPPVQQFAIPNLANITTTGLQVISDTEPSRTGAALAAQAPHRLSINPAQVYSDVAPNENVRGPTYTSATRPEDLVISDVQVISNIPPSSGAPPVTGPAPAPAPAPVVVRTTVLQALPSYLLKFLMLLAVLAMLFATLMGLGARRERNSWLAANEFTRRMGWHLRMSGGRSDGFGLLSWFLSDQSLNLKAGLYG